MTTTVKKSSRNPALDFTKGALVLIMVLYHWINYFLGGRDNRYLRFLTPSFIFITGFLISYIYLSKYATAQRPPEKRLLVRGLKLLGVFLALNVMRIPFMARNLQKPGASDDSPLWSLFNIYVVGSGVGGGQLKAVAFFILIPIAYLLMLCSILAIAYRVLPYVFHATCALFLLCIIALSTQGIQSPNLELVTIGLIGVLCGFLPKDRFEIFVRYPFFLTGAYFLYLGSITLWNVIYPLQIIGVFLSLMILYSLGQTNGEAGSGKNIVILLGQYSLFGYIAQIAVLQCLRRVVIYLDLDVPALPLLAGSFVSAIIVTILIVAAVDRFRAKSPLVNRLYNGVFA